MHLHAATASSVHSKAYICVAVTAGDGNCGYRAVMAGIIESAQSSGHLKGHLLQRLPELLKMILRLAVIDCLGTSYALHLQQGCSHLMVSTQTLLSCVASLHAFTPIGLRFGASSD